MLADYQVPFRPLGISLEATAPFLLPDLIWGTLSPLLGTINPWHSTLPNVILYSLLLYISKLDFTAHQPVIPIEDPVWSGVTSILKIFAKNFLNIVSIFVRWKTRDLQSIKKNWLQKLACLSITPKYSISFLKSI